VGGEVPNATGALPITAAVDAGLPALTIQTTTNLQSGTWVYAGDKAPVNGTNTWSGAALPRQLFYRLAVTNAP
jgi:hypothetical protein